jgi:hypothetical protein
MKKLLLLVTALFMVIGLVALALPGSPDVSAIATPGELKNVSDMLTNYAAGASANHDIRFTPVQNLPADGKVRIVFPSGFNLSGVSASSVTIEYYSSGVWVSLTNSTTISGQTVSIIRDGNIMDADKQFSIRINSIVNPTECKPYTLQITILKNNGNVWAAGSCDIVITCSTLTATTLAVSPATSIYGGTVNLTATLTNTSGSSPVSGKSISFSLNSISKGSVTTNGTGVATLTGVSISGISAGSYTDYIGASFTGDSGYGSSSGTATLTVTKATATVTLGSLSQTYDGSAKHATATTDPAGLHVDFTYDGSATEPTDADSYAVVGTVDDANYEGTDSDTMTISKVDANISVTGWSGTYDGNAHGASGTATGIESPTPANLNSLLHVAATTYTDVPGGSVSWTFDGNTNYNSDSGSTTVTITQADAIFDIDGYNVTYDGNAHTATGTATGVESPTPVDLTSLLTLTGTTHTDAGNYPSDGWSFAGNTNYKSASGTVADKIDKANAVIDIDGYDVTYDGDEHTATGTATGVETPTPVDLTSLLTLTGTTHTDAGSYPSDGWSFAGNTNYKSASGTVADKIDKADAIFDIDGYNVTYDGNAHTATGTATGVESPTPVDLTSLLTLTGTTHTDAGSYPSDGWSFAGNTNYKSASGTVADNINQKALTITATNRGKTYGQTVIFAGTEFTPTGLIDGAVDSVTLFSAGAAAGAAVGPYDIEPSNAIGSGLSNYDITYDNGTLTVSKAAALTITANDSSKIYGAAVTFAGTEFTVSGLKSGDSVTSVTLNSAGAGAAANVDTYVIVPSSAVGIGLTNYDSISYANGTLTVNRAIATINVNGYDGVYDGNAHGAALVSATGVGGANLNASVNLGATYTNVPGGIATWIFSNPNYNGQSDDVTINITKADVTIVVTAYNVTYDGLAHTATGTARGVDDTDLGSGLNLSGTTHTNIGTYSNDHWSFNYSNYNDASGTVNDKISAHEVLFNINGSTGTWNLSSSGVLLEDVKEWSPTKDVSINISAGTTMLVGGQPIDEFNVSVVASPPPAPGAGHVLAAFDFRPNGATFNPGIEITIAFNSSEVAAGETVSIAFYNVSTSAWQYIMPPATVTDRGGNMAAATFNVTHFTIYSPLTVPGPTPIPYRGGYSYTLPTPEPTATAAPTSTPAATPTSAPTATPASTPAPTASPAPTNTPAPTYEPEEEEGMKAPKSMPTQTPAVLAVSTSHSGSNGSNIDWIWLLLIIVWSIVVLLGLGLITRILLRYRQS